MDDIIQILNVLKQKFTINFEVPPLRITFCVKTSTDISVFSQNTISCLKNRVEK